MLREGTLSKFLHFLESCQNLALKKSHKTKVTTVRNEHLVRELFLSITPHLLMYKSVPVSIEPEEKQDYGVFHPAKTTQYVDRNCSFYFGKSLALNFIFALWCNQARKDYLPCQIYFARIF